MSGRPLANLDGLMESLGRLKSAWASQGIECGVPATDAELAEFERSHRVCLPDDVREYFLRVNGMARNEWWQWDDDLINFYPLAELIRCEETAGPTATTAPPPSGAVYAIGSRPVLNRTDLFRVPVPLPQSRRRRAFRLGQRLVATRQSPCAFYSPRIRRGRGWTPSPNSRARSTRLASPSVVG